MNKTPYPGTGWSNDDEERPWDDLAGLVGTRPGAAPPGADLCGPGCQYRKLYEGSQLSLDDLHETLEEAVKKYQDLRAGLISLTKRAFSGQVRRTERQLGQRISGFTDRQIIANLDDYIRNVTQPARTQKAGLTALRTALTQIGYELPEDDNPATWAAVIAATGPIGERRGGYPASNLLGQDTPEVNTENLDDDFAELLKDFDLPEITTGGRRAEPRVDRTSERSGTPAPSQQDDRHDAPGQNRDAEGERSDIEPSQVDAAADDALAGEELGNAVDLAALLAGDDDTPTHAVPSGEAEEGSGSADAEESLFGGDVDLAALVEGWDDIPENDSGPGAVGVLGEADETGGDEEGAAGSDDLTGLAESDAEGEEDLSLEDVLLDDEIDIDALMGGAGVGDLDMGGGEDSLEQLDADLADLDSLTGSEDPAGGDSPPGSEGLTGGESGAAVPETNEPEVVQPESEAPAATAPSDEDQPFALEGYVLPSAVTSQHTRPGSAGFNQPKVPDNKPAKAATKKKNSSPGPVKEKKDKGVKAIRPASFNFDVPDLAGVADGEPLPDHIVDVLVEAAESPRPVFIVDLTEAGVDRATAEAWEAQMRGVNNPPVRFASGRKRHREQLGSLVLPHRMTQKPTAEFAKSTWHSLLTTYRGVVLYEFAALLRSFGDAVISSKTTPDYAVLRANLPQGLTGIVVVTTTDPAGVADEVAGEVRGLLDERLSSIMILAARPDLEDVLVGKLDELLAENQPFPTPVAVSSIWKYAQDRTGAAKLLGGLG